MRTAVRWGSLSRAHFSDVTKRKIVVGSIKGFIDFMRSKLKRIKIMSLKVGLVFLALSASVANAGLISIDDAELGIGKITRDITAQLDWLDLDLTADLSWNEAERDYAAFGFSHATVLQVEELFVNAGIPDIGTGTSVGNYAPSLALQNLITCRPGFNSTFSISLCSSFAFTALDSSGRSELSWIDRNDTSGKSTVIADSNNFISGSGALETFKHVSRSHWMVRSVEVPEPSSFYLAGLGFVSLLVLKRKKAK